LLRIEGEVTPFDPFDSLTADGADVLSNHPIGRDFRVDAQGKVDLGEPYGSFTVKGLTLEEAEQAIAKQLKDILVKPEISVTLTGWKRE
jgi:protein involved in polysaccharide export with SLBB domain